MAIITKKRDAYNIFKNKALKLISLETYAKLIILTDCVEYLKIPVVYEGDFEMISKLTNIDEMELPLLFFSLEQLYPPVLKVNEDGSYSFLALIRQPTIRAAAGEKVPSYPRGSENFLKITDKELEQLQKDISPGELKTICEEVEDWLQSSPKGRTRDSHYRTIKTFLRGKASRGLVYSGRGPSGAGYYPAMLIKRLQESENN